MASAVRPCQYPREMIGGGRRIVQEAQRDPAGGELLIDAVIALRRRRRLARHAIGGLRVVIVEQLAHQQAAFRPPLVEIDQGRGFLRRGQDQPAGFLRFVAFAQPLHLGENIAGVAARRSRHRVERGLGIAGFLDYRRAGARNHQIVAAKTLGGAHARLDILGIKALLHARLVIGGRKQVAEQFDDFFLDIGAGFVLAPGMPH
jgi:hypothetical protein